MSQTRAPCEGGSAWRLPGVCTGPSGGEMVCLGVWSLLGLPPTEIHMTYGGRCEDNVAPGGRCGGAQQWPGSRHIASDLRPWANPEHRPGRIHWGAAPCPRSWVETPAVRQNSWPWSRPGPELGRSDEMK